MLTKLEKIELITIPTFGIGFCLLLPMIPISAPIFTLILLPEILGFGNLLLLMSSLLLLQGLVRDLSLLARAKRMPQSTVSEGTVRSGRLMCMESIVGMTGILLGIGILGLGGFGINQPIRMANWEWSLLVMLMMSAGFAIKDLVIQTNPWQIVRDKDHMNIVFKWK